MNIEIWSDIACPFCYIGKRHLEEAKDLLPFKDELNIIWKSFQLDPTYHNTKNETIYEQLENSKGMSVDQVKQMTGQVLDMATNAGLKFNFEQITPANTFDAHRLIHLASHHNLQDQAKEALLQAYFIDGKDVADKTALLKIAEDIGLDQTQILETLDSDKFSDEVKHDIKESRDIGVQGVPFFVLDRKYAISGAQPVTAFKDALTQAYKEWKSSQPVDKLTSLNVSGNAICDDDGCEV